MDVVRTGGLVRVHTVRWRMSLLQSLTFKFESSSPLYKSQWVLQSKDVSNLGVGSSSGRTSWSLDD